MNSGAASGPDRGMKILIYLFLFCTLCTGCLLPEDTGAEGLTIVSWNVQNLFDEVSDGNEYDEYNPEKGEWDEQKMRIKLENLTELLLTLDGGLPDILLLQEVENTRVLDILDEEYLGDVYSYREAWKDRDSAIACGILSKPVPGRIHLHFPGEWGGRALRPVVEIHFDLGSETLVVFNNHWKSRSGGQLATEEGRIRSVEVLVSRIRELRSEGYNDIIVAGDLNGSAEDYRSGGSRTAQVPVDALFDTPWEESLHIASDKADTFMESTRVILFDPWKDMDREGSYFFQNRWMKLDHIMLSRGLLDGEGLNYGDASCISLPVNSSDEGRPLVWESWREAGCSDHFPLFLSLTPASP